MSSLDSEYTSIENTRCPFCEAINDADGIEYDGNRREATAVCGECGADYVVKVKVRAMFVSPAVGAWPE